MMSHTTRFLCIIDAEICVNATHESNKQVWTSKVICICIIPLIQEVPLEKADGSAGPHGDSNDFLPAP